MAIIGLRSVVCCAVLARSARRAAAAYAASCTRDDFANVVEQAGDTLRALNGENTPVFQTKLRTLKDRASGTTISS